MPVHFRNYTAAVKRVIGSGQNVGLAPHQVVIGNAGGGLGQVAGTGAAGQVLTSAGPGADPSFAAVAGGPADKEVWLSGLALPTGLGYTVLAENFPRLLASSNFTMSSITPRCTIACLPAGLVLSRMTMFTSTAAASGVSHGWYAITDNNFKVVAVTADQTTAFWNTINSPFTLLFTASYTTAYRGNYYFFVSTTATSNPNFCAAPAPDIGPNSAAPVLGGLGPSSGSGTPPALGTTISPISANGPVAPYACVG